MVNLLKDKSSSQFLHSYRRLLSILKAIEFLARRSEDERAECTFEYMSTRSELQQRQKFKCEEYKEVLNGY